MLTARPSCFPVDILLCFVIHVVVVFIEVVIVLFMHLYRDLVADE